MIDFACKRFKLEEIVKCGFGLTKNDFAVLMWFMKRKGEADSEEISRKLSIGLTTSQKSLKRLYEKGLIIRTQKNLSDGGYAYYYRIQDKKMIKSKLMTVLHSWISGVEKSMDDW